MTVVAVMLVVVSTACVALTLAWLDAERRARHANHRAEAERLFCGFHQRAAEEWQATLDRERRRVAMVTAMCTHEETVPDVHGLARMCADCLDGVPPNSTD